MLEAMQPVEAVTRARTVLAGEPGVRWAYLFGSCARGEPHRDFDLAIMPVAGAFPTLVAWGRLVADLEAALGGRVDLVDLTDAPLSLAGTLLVDRIVVVDHEIEQRHAWEAATTSRWIDFRFALERAAKVRRQAMEQRLRGAG